MQKALPLVVCNGEFSVVSAGFCQFGGSPLIKITPISNVATGDCIRRPLLADVHNTRSVESAPSADPHSPSLCNLRMRLVASGVLGLGAVVMGVLLVTAASNPVVGALAILAGCLLLCTAYYSGREIRESGRAGEDGSAINLTTVIGRKADVSKMSHKDFDIRFLKEVTREGVVSERKCGVCDKLLLRPMAAQRMIEGPLYNCLQKDFGLVGGKKHELEGSPLNAGDLVLHLPGGDNGKHFDESLERCHRLSQDEDCRSKKTMREFPPKGIERINKNGFHAIVTRVGYTPEGAPAALLYRYDRGGKKVRLCLGSEQVVFVGLWYQFRS